MRKIFPSFNVYDLSFVDDLLFEFACLMLILPWDPTTDGRRSQGTKPGAYVTRARASHIMRRQCNSTGLPN
eukprot:13922788-Ditylum_brightwellii.AAC.1